MKFKKKILKNIIIQQSLAFFCFLYIRLVKLTSKIVEENSNIPEIYWKNNKPFILAFWHHQLMMISFCWKSKKRINILASGHSDGRFGALIGKYFNLNNIQTSSSSSKNALSLKPIFNLLKNSNYVGITPDGPRGPNQKVSEGIIKIAKSSNIPIIPVGFASTKFKKLNSWDKFLITLPFSKCVFVWGNPLEIPNNSKNIKIKEYQSILEKNINDCILSAEKYLNV